MWRHGGEASGGERGRRSSRGGGPYASHPQWRTVRGAARPPQPPGEHQAVHGTPDGGGRERPPPPLAAHQRPGQLWPARASGPPPPRRPTARLFPPCSTWWRHPRGPSAVTPGAAWETDRTEPPHGAGRRPLPAPAAAERRRRGGPCARWRPCGSPPRAERTGMGDGGRRTGGTLARPVSTVPLCPLASARLFFVLVFYGPPARGRVARAARPPPPKDERAAPPRGGPPAHRVTHTAS